jgi:hypothetical protein
MENEHCMLLALPCGRDHMDVLQQSTNLTAGFITYLQRKQAAGIVNVAPPGHQQVRSIHKTHIMLHKDLEHLLLRPLWRPAVVWGPAYEIRGPRFKSR